MLVNKLLKFTVFKTLILKCETAFDEFAEAPVVHQRAINELHFAEKAVDEKQYGVNTDSRADIECETFHTCSAVEQIYDF